MDAVGPRGGVRGQFKFPHPSTIHARELIKSCVTSQTWTNRIHPSYV